MEAGRSRACKEYRRLNVHEKRKHYGYLAIIRLSGPCAKHYGPSRTIGTGVEPEGNRSLWRIHLLIGGQPG